MSRNGAMCMSKGELVWPIRTMLLVSMFFKEDKEVESEMSNLLRNMYDVSNVFALKLV